MHDNPHPSLSTVPDSFTGNMVENDDEIADKKEDDPFSSTCYSLIPLPHATGCHLECVWCEQ